MLKFFVTASLEILTKTEKNREKKSIRKCLAARGTQVNEQLPDCHSSLLLRDKSRCLHPHLICSVCGQTIQTSLSATRTYTVGVKSSCKIWFTNWPKRMDLVHARPRADLHLKKKKEGMEWFITPLPKSSHVRKKPPPSLLTITNSQGN